MQKKASGSGSGQNVLHTVNSAHFQPVNSTLVFSKASPLQNEKIREPEELLQLSEILYFQAFFGIQFCTLVINTTVSTWLERVVLIASLSSNPLFLVVTSPTIPLYLREQVKAEILRKCLYFSK